MSFEGWACSAGASAAPKVPEKILVFEVACTCAALEDSTVIQQKLSAGDEVDMRIGMLLVLAAVLSPAARADVRPHALCSDGMVLQQKATVAIWGIADAGERVTVTFREVKSTTTADANGRWAVQLQSGAAGGPFPMTIAGNNVLEYREVLVGEVWVCSGQSNMEWTVNASGPQDGKNAKDAPANPQLRMFTVKRNPKLTPQSEVSGTWNAASPETVGAMSAVGYFFGRSLNEHLKVPVGMISTSWGGTRAEAWTKREALATVPRQQADVDTLQKLIQAEKNQEEVKMTPNTASVLYNGMVAPLVNYRIKGVIWYQGESNAGKAWDYRTLFPTMIENWRADWKQPDMPFYFVQLAPFGAAAKMPGSSNWAELREAQLLTLKLPHTGMAVITDLGNEYDIHPTPKRPVGERLARLARAQDYGEKIVYSGPKYQGMQVQGGKVVLKFEHIGGGLVSHELVPTLEREGKPGAAWRIKPGTEGAPLVGFAIAGEDKVFHNATADIVGHTVVVHSPEVSAPVAVRYGWANHPICNLFNREGLPASPFRTDNFPLSTAPKE